MKEINLFLDWKANAQFAGVIWAKEHDLYKKSGLDVNIIPWDGTSLVTEHLDNELPGLNIASIEDNLFLKELDQNKNYYAVATMMQRSPIAFMSKKVKNIELTHESLSGKKFGVHIDGKSMLQMLLHNNHLSSQEISVSELGCELDEFIHDGLDILQCYAVIEPNIIRRMGIPVDVFPAVDWGYEVYSQVMVCKKDLCLEYQQEISSFIKNTFDGWKYAFIDSLNTAKIICDKYCPDEDIDLQKIMIEQLEPWIFDKINGYYNGQMTSERWLKANDLYVIDGQISKMYNPADYAAII